MPRIRRQTNYEYWQEREQRQLIANQAEEAIYNAKLNHYHLLLETEIDQQIQAFYQRYAGAEGITLADAQRRVAQADIKSFEAKAKEYVALAEQDRLRGTDTSATYFSKRANQEMRLYNAMMRINRLELLKAELGMNIDVYYRDMEIELDAALRKRVEDELRRQAGILGATVFHNEEDVGRIVNASFHNATWSERLWGEGDRLKSSLSILLTNGLIQGVSSLDLARRLRQAYDVSRFESERLLRTEMARVQTDAQMEAYRRNGYERYMFIPLEGGACPECAAIGSACLEAGGFLVADEEVGLNSPPIHPNCRCSTAAQAMTRDAFAQMMEDRYGIPFTNEDPQAIIETERSLNSEQDENFELLKMELEAYKIERVPIMPLPRQETEAELIAKLGGGDMTGGSCSSLALAYAGRRKGLDVLDFRGGASRVAFAKARTIGHIANLKGVESIIIKQSNDIKATREIFSQLNKGNEYYFATGNHAAIVRFRDEHWQYLELQSVRDNGFYPLTNSVLQNRFGAVKRHTRYGKKAENTSFAIELDSLANNANFEGILEYINTNVDAQKKGKTGSAR